MQRRPELRVGRVYRAPVLQQEAAHVLVVVDAALRANDYYLNTHLYFKYVYKYCILQAIKLRMI